MKPRHQHTSGVRRVKTFVFSFGISLLLIALNGCQIVKVSQLLRGGQVQEGPFYVTVPFEFRAGLPIVQVEVNGLMGNFLFDTGAPNIISREFAERLNLKDKAKVGVNDSGGNRQSRQSVVEIDSIKIGGVGFTNMAAVVQDLQSSDIFKCLGFDGIIGANLMRQAYWKIDYTAQTIVFSSQLADFEMDSTYLAISFAPKRTGTPMVAIEVNGIPLSSITFDTGSNKGFSLPLRYLRNYQDSLQIETTWELGSNSFGVGGIEQTDTIFHAAIDSLLFGGHHLTQTIVTFDKNSNTIGNEFLQHYDVVFDWNSQKIYLRKVSTYDNNALVTHGFGIILVNGGLQVSSIYHGTEAEGQLQVGDRVLRIDEYDFDTAPDGLICDLVKTRAIKFRERESIDITVQRGEETLAYTLKRVNLLPANP